MKPDPTELVTKLPEVELTDLGAEWMASFFADMLVWRAGYGRSAKQVSRLLDISLDEAETRYDRAQRWFQLVSLLLLIAYTRYSYAQEEAAKECRD